jgi:hypothetical protein
MRSDRQDGFNAGLALHKGFVYVGTWGNSNACPGASIKVVDAANPAAPVQVATLAEYPLSTSQEVAVRDVVTAAFSGTLLATGLQRCVAGGRSGLDLWDVTNPRNPLHLGMLDLGSSVGGVAALDLEVRGNQAFAYLAVPGGENTGLLAGLVVADVSAPFFPRVIGGFGLPADLGIPVGPEDYVHSVRVDTSTRRAYVSYGDAGVVLLDVGDPSRPRFLGRTTFPDGADGNAHSSTLAKNGALLVQCDQDTRTDARGGIEAGSGYVRLQDLGNLVNPTEVGSYRTANAALAAPPAGIYTANEAEVAGNNAFVAWFSDGIRVVDITAPGNPREVAWYVPPAVADPFRVFPTAPLVWGIALSGDLVFASDINAGLYVLRFQ